MKEHVPAGTASQTTPDTRMSAQTSPSTVDLGKPVWER